MNLRSRLERLEKRQEPDEILESLKEVLRETEPFTVPDDVVDIASALAALAERLPE